jgi:hypothetical protein
MLPSGLPELVADDEDIARFLTSSGHFNAKMVKPSAFQPDPDHHEKSVCRHGKEPQDDLRQLATEYLRPGTKLLGVGICKAADVRAVKLDVLAFEPPPRHANIIGWPVIEDSDLQKAKDKELAGAIASKCERVIF